MVRRSKWAGGAAAERAAQVRSRIRQRHFGLLSRCVLHFQHAERGERLSRGRGLCRRSTGPSGAIHPPTTHFAHPHRQALGSETLHISTSACYIVRSGIAPRPLSRHFFSTHARTCNTVRNSRRARSTTARNTDNAQRQSLACCSHLRPSTRSRQLNRPVYSRRLLLPQTMSDVQKTVPSGVYAPLYTFFHENESLDLEAFKQHVGWVASAGGE